MTVKEGEWDAAAKIRRILLATDFSSGSETAVALAIRWARSLRADVEVFHAIPGTKSDDASGSDSGSNDDSTGARERALAGLQSILSRMLEAGVPASAELAHGAAAVEIAKRAASSRANLVIMGRHGQSRVRDVLCGSVADRVLRHVKCSVLLAPDAGPTIM